MQQVLRGRWGVLGVALASGLIAALGQAPWGLWYLALPALAAVALLVALTPTARGAFGRAWLAGAAQFAVALAWIVEPFLIDSTTHGWMAPFALLGMACGLALFWGAAAALAAGALQRPVARIWAFAGAMLAFEALRGHLFTGFPWALTGHIWIGTPADQLAAYGGSLLLSALALGLAATLATVAYRLTQGRILRASLVALGGAIAAAAALGLGAFRLAAPLPPPLTPVVRLVQGNVPQHLKWQPDLVEGFYHRHLALSATAADAPPALVIWPESAAPFLLDSAGDGLRMAIEAAGVPLIFGVDRRARDEAGRVQYFNALALIGMDAQVAAVYDKHHLVPFGEYIPLIGQFAEGFGGLASQALSGYAPGPGVQIVDLAALGLEGFGQSLPLICYEAVFARNLRSETRPDWVLQITNDAWFGTGIGPFQHLAQAQLRAVEFGLPLVRAANTGVSAMIDARGRITAALPLGEQGVLDAHIPGAMPATPYARIGDTPWHVALSLLALWLALRGWRRRGSA
ncbi:apolipoprotein N-acyltransferase [Pararhodobacter oceanensis]|uniref:Apolipoprotein N-acyltransferase n=1 Tax=Pararhodobacter oceanensis TaxID=2172121 RepID=A0A2T8HX45_9RHOB|nr:apolipoprotein N-acyltransferase [Pararhodobacter oceanensis]